MQTLNAWKLFFCAPDFNNYLLLFFLAYDVSMDMPTKAPLAERIQTSIAKALKAEGIDHVTFNSDPSEIKVIFTVPVSIAPYATSESQIIRTIREAVKKMYKYWHEEGERERLGTCQIVVNKKGKIQGSYTKIDSFIIGEL